MSFFEKMKQGASDAAKKAQQTMEITRLRTQISSKEKELEKIFTLIGESVYNAHAAGDWKKSQPDVAAYCQQIQVLRQDIQHIELKIKEAKHEKVCQCGKVVAREVKFCSVCGHQFEELREQAEQAETVVHTICRVCRTTNEPDAKFCGSCGIAM
ncbi:zinc ribbon domain-containing protein [Paenibacillus radicis (ex Xue et al. 2023)]|uniref:Zinc ribbon domain-containing protein n=1 Tax=Paenibacillus radicis (ex Xue et al. 2023) TaxID=2972489 RepID=A0ABT1Y9A0_9BACL|nr:zinc ribbon domain-containing protein [Paenibacillus radicis (ex Xue et al. 2023)]MCR8629764.1 zinc ribbon domain-containing protein [Paenibacillus radicis (ex Xue et al. 2023)]